MSTPQPGGDRDPLVITRPVAGGRPGDDEEDAADTAGNGSTADDAGAAGAASPSGAGGTPAKAGGTPAKAGATPAKAGATPAKAGATPAKAGATRAKAGGARAGRGTAGSGATAAGGNAGEAAAAGRGTAAGRGAPGGRGTAADRGARPTGRSGGKSGPATSGRGGARRPVTPVKVGQGRNWGPLALWTAVVVIVLAIIGYGGWQVYQNGLSWSDRASQISGVVNYRKIEPDIMKPAQHEYGSLKYPQSPPVGGTHNPNWQDCMGDVYDAAIANEHAVHSMEHGAIWVTYRPDLPKSQVDQLTRKVRGNPYMLMSPYPGLDKPISLQTWGYQLKVDNAGDKRIDAFVKALRQNASVEPGAVCSGGITLTGTTPHDLQPQQGGDTGMGG